MAYQFNPFTSNLDLVGASATWLAPVANAAALPASAADGAIAVTLDTHEIYEYTGSTWVLLAETIVSVKHFGAKGDNSTDDTAAIQDALDFVSSGGTVLFPQGTYLISSYLTPNDNTHLLGEGTGSVIKRKTGSYINDLLGTYHRGFIDSHDGSNIRIEKLKFDGQGSWTGSSFSNPYDTGNSVGYNNAEIAIHMKKVSTSPTNISIVDCEFTGVEQAVHFDEVDRIKVVNNYIHQVGRAGLAFYDSSYITCSNNRVENVQGNITTAGDTATSSSKYADCYYFGNCTDVVVDDNIAYNFQRTGILLQPNGGGSNSTRFIISNNNVSHGHDARGTEFITGIYVADGSLTSPIILSNNAIDDMVYSGSGYGIVAENVTINGGSITNCSNAGILCQEEVSVNGTEVQTCRYGIRVDGNTAPAAVSLKDCRVKNNTAAGIYLDNSHGNIEILNCLIEDNGTTSTSGSTAGACSGVAINQYYNDQKVIIKNNTFVSSNDTADTSGQLYGILGIAGGDFNYSTQYVENNTFLFTGSIASYPTNLAAVPCSFAYDNTSVIAPYELVNDLYGNFNSKAPWNEGEINFAYQAGHPRFLGYRSSAPVSGTYEQGDYFLNHTLSSTTQFMFVCVTAGTPGTWKAWGGNNASDADINETSFSAANNQASVANVTGLAFSNSAVRSFDALVSVYVNAGTPLYEVFRLQGVQKGSSWEMSQSSTGDSSGFVFTITNAGQIQYVNSNYASFTAATVKFRAITTSV